MTDGHHALDDAARAALHEAAIGDTVRVLREAPDAVVPFYPEWRVRDLVVHIVESHMRGCLVLEAGASERPTFTVDIVADAPLDVLAEALERVGARLREDAVTCEHREVWTLGSDRSPRFWLRRMLMEATLHRWDAESAVGESRPPEPIVAVDGVGEFLDVAVLRKLRTLDAPSGGRVLFRTADRTWLLDMAEPSLRQHTTDTADVSTVAGSPGDMWLWLNRRTPIEAAVAVEDASGAVARFEALISRFGRPAEPRA